MKEWKSIPPLVFLSASPPSAGEEREEAYERVASNGARND